MTGNPQPLDRKFPIVNSDGTPNEYFIRWAQQRQIDIGQGITAEQAEELVNAYALFDHLLEDLGGDPGADRLLFWDDSESTFRFLKLGSNLSITDDTINAAGGGGGGGVAPVYRSSTIQQASASTVTVPWPAGAAAGDRVIIFCQHAFTINPPPGWDTLNQWSDTNVNGAAFTRVLTDADISQGSIVVVAAGAFNYTYCAVCFVGAPTIRGVSAARSSAGAASHILAPPVASAVGDMQIAFGANRAASANSISPGTSRQQANAANSSGGFNTFTETVAGGSPFTFTYGTAGTGYFECIVTLAA